MCTWTDDDPKARQLIARKHGAIITAALDAFLEEGYARSPVNRIAASAGVSITTLFRHFSSKGDLFVAVIQEALQHLYAGEDPAWLDMPPFAAARPWRP
ncbi:TetR/AcrR family transcriptional regulator [Streptomyces sp. NPDC055157]